MREKRIKSLFAAAFVMLFAPVVASCDPMGMIYAQQYKLNQRGTAFIPSLPDVPLPEHFEIDTTTSTFFDSVDGRIVEINAMGFENVEYIAGFYRTLMPQFGWQEVDPLVFAKEGEVLIITPQEGNYMNTIKFRLRPGSYAI